MSATRLSFSYPSELKEKIQIIANKETRPLSQMVQIFIKEGLEKRGVSSEVKKTVRKKSKLKKRRSHGNSTKEEDKSKRK